MKVERGKRGSSFVRIGDADLFTDTQSVAIQAGVKIQQMIETAAVGCGNLPTCVPGLDVIVGAALRTSLRRWRRVNGPNQPENKKKGDGNEQDEREQGTVG